MRTTEPIPNRVLTVLVVLVGIGTAGIGCLSSSGVDPPAADADWDSNELTCELALLRFEKLIEARSSENGFSTAALIEATEIYRMSKQLYLEREYRLALTLIEEGIQLVE